MDTANILLVDDEIPFVEAMTKRLSKRGINIATAFTGQEALEYLAAGKDVDVVILDVVMPKLNGREIFEAMLAIDPNVIALVSTGYSVEGEARAILEIGAAGFLAKPFRRAELAKKVSEVFLRQNA